MKGDLVVKKIYKILVLSMFLFIFPLFVKANTINNIDMDIYVDKLGTAHVTENWNVNYQSDTELYKSYKNLGNAKISNFKVRNSNKEFTYEDNWNINGSFDEKKYKNGLHYIEDGVELCWGISEYGNSQYTLTYNIEGFVVGLNDSNMVYWNFIPSGKEIGNVHIKMYSDIKYSEKLPVWGYGNYGGTAYVYDGYIEMNSEGSLNDNEYMTILVKFDNGTFQTPNKENKDFSYYKNLAEQGATKYKKSFLQIIFDILKTIFCISFWGIIIFSVVKGIKKSNNTIGSKEFDFGNDKRKLPKDIPNFRDIPFNNDIFKTFWIAECYKLNDKKTDFLGAILLKWLKENKISVIKSQTGLLKNKEESAINLQNNFESDNKYEVELYNMMKYASKDGILESKEFENWCSSHYNDILLWFDNVLDEETSKLTLEGKITEEEKKSFKIFKSQVYKIDSSIQDDAIKLKGFKNFLEEFSRIDDKEAIEVKMWEYYLIYAQILGIADKVAKQFKKLYPEIIENNNYGYTYNDIIFINTISYHGMSSALSSKSRAESYSSGGGGFSSGGGGGGSFGGGGSIGSR